MTINVSVQHNGGFLPGIILLNQCYYHHRETRSNVMKKFCICILGSHLNVLTFSPLTGGCSEGLDAFRFFFKQNNKNTAEQENIRITPTRTYKKRRKEKRDLDSGTFMLRVRCYPLHLNLNLFLRPSTV